MSDTLTKEISAASGRAGPGAWFARMHPIVPWLIVVRCPAAAAVLPHNAYTQFVVNVMAINIILAVGLNIVKGFAGQVTVGHVALMAIGAYSSAVVSTMLGFPFWLALPCAMLITALRRRARRHSVAAA